ncbi:hypothetical protein SLA2020_427390 [Shorea laevis]
MNNKTESIRYISKSNVQASTPKEAAAQRIELTPWDLQLLLVGPIQKGLLFYKPKPQQVQAGPSLIRHLNASLSCTLDHFPPLAGRFVATEHGDDTTSFYINCNNVGALFVHAIADGVSISDIIEPLYVPSILHSFFPLNGVKNIDSTSEPILGVQVTELVDGIFIGCTMNHTVCDGTSFWHFFNSWAEISRGSVSLSNSPVLERWFLEGSDFPIRIPNSQIKQIHEKFIPLPTQDRVFHFTKENITKLKAKANAEADTNKISSLQALLAHLWRSVSRLQHLDPNTEVHYTLLIGARPRLKSLPIEYFGSAIQAGTVTLKAGELVEQGLGNVAWQMNRMVASHTEEKLKEFLESWTRSPRLIMEGSFTKNALVTSSSPQFNIYGNDFGWGKPIAVRSGKANKSGGKITVYRGVEEGSVDIEACLSPETLEALGNDEEFMAAVTI